MTRRLATPLRFSVAHGGFFSLFPSICVSKWKVIRSSYTQLSSFVLLLPEAGNEGERWIQDFTAGQICFGIYGVIIPAARMKEKLSIKLKRVEWRAGPVADPEKN